MPDDPKEPVTPSANSGGDPSNDPTPPKTFTQEEVDRIAAREKNEGKRAGSREALETLGVDSLEAAADLLKAKKDEETAKLTEVDRQQQAAAKQMQEANKLSQEAKKERFEAKIERQLLVAELPLKHLARAVRLVVLDDYDADQETIKAAVESLKEDVPELFGAVTEVTDPNTNGGGPKPPSSDPKGAPTKVKVNEDAFKRGAERAQAASGKK